MTKRILCCLLCGVILCCIIPAYAEESKAEALLRQYAEALLPIKKDWSETTSIPIAYPDTTSAAIITCLQLGEAEIPVMLMTSFNEEYTECTITIEPLDGVMPALEFGEYDTVFTYYPLLAFDQPKMHMITNTVILCRPLGAFEEESQIAVIYLVNARDLWGDDRTWQVYLRFDEETCFLKHINLVAC